MEHRIENEIKREICKFNDTLFSLIRNVDRELELDENTFTIIENSNKFLIFCAVKDYEKKDVGDPVCVVYDEDARRNSALPPVYYGRSLAQYRKVYEKTSGQCQIIKKKTKNNFRPEDSLWYYKLNGFVIYEKFDGSFGLSKNVMG